jgi:hypothetical protein
MEVGMVGASFRMVSEQSTAYRAPGSGPRGQELWNRFPERAETALPAPQADGTASKGAAHRNF